MVVYGSNLIIMEWYVSPKKNMVPRGWIRSFLPKSVSKGTHMHSTNKFTRTYIIYSILYFPAFARWKDSDERKAVLAAMSPGERKRRRYD